MLINKTNLDTIFLNLKAQFHKSWEDTTPQWDQIAMMVDSMSSRNEYKWLSEFPRMRRWIGEKTIKSFEGFAYTIINEDWESTVAVNRNDIEDDMLGIYAPQARMAGYSARRFPDEIVFGLVNNGFADLCYDGQEFFSATHPVGDEDVSNLLTKALAGDTLDNAKASFGAARTALLKQVDEEGRPLGVMPDTLLVPSALFDTAMALMTADRLEDGKVNIYKKAAKVLHSPWLTSDTAWFLLDTMQPIKPFIYQERKKPMFVQQTDMDSDSVFTRKEYRYGVECRANGGYGFWQMAIASDGTT